MTRSYAFAVALLVSFGFPSCSLDALSPGSVRLSLPELPPDYRYEVDGWSIAWWDGSRVRRTTITLGAAESVRGVDLPLSSSGADVVCATARPRVGEMTLLPVGGWVQPPKRELAAQARLGPVSEAILVLAERGTRPEFINLRRLRSAVEAEAFASPYDLDVERITREMGNREMDRYAVAARDRPACLVRTAAADVDAPSAWISDNTLEGRVAATPAGRYLYWSVPVAAGEVRRWFRRSGSGLEWLIVGRDRSGHAAWVRRSRARPVND